MAGDGADDNDDNDYDDGDHDHDNKDDDDANAFDIFDTYVTSLKYYFSPSLSHLATLKQEHI